MGKEFIYSYRKTNHLGGNMNHISLHTESRDRCESLALYLIENQSTVRDTATHFGVSKSTVHKDVREKLPRINPTLFTEVDTLLEKNKSERHLRGGEATKRKYRAQTSDRRMDTDVGIPTK